MLILRKEALMAQILKAGVEAPDFTLPVTADQKISIKEFKGKPLILAFYPADFSPVCSDQISLYNEILPEFKKFNAEIFGISVDGYWCHTAFKGQNHIHFLLLSDFEPKGDVSKKYGVYNEETGTSERALFVIDKDGKIFWSFLSPVGDNPGADGILDALEKLPK